jgi:hypothetical protein
MIAEPLAELVASLEKQEKRYLSVALSGKRKSEDFIPARIFRQMLSGKSQAATGSEKHLAVLKTQLWHRLLSLLVSYHRSQQPDQQLSEGIAKLSVLFSKKLFRQAERLLHSLQRKTSYTHRPALYAELVAWELRLLHSASELSGMKKKLPVIFKKQEECLSAQRQIYQMQKLTYEVFIGLRSNWFTAATVKTATQKELESIREKDLLSPHATILYYQTQSTLCLARNDKAAALHVLEKMIRLLENNGQLQKHFVNQYIATLNNLNLLFLQEKKYSRILENISRLKAIRTASAEKQMRISERVHTVEMNVYLETGNLPAAEKTWTAMGKLLSGNRLSSVYRKLFFVLGFRYYFISGNFRQALRQLSRFAQEKDRTSRPDLHRAVSLLELIVHFELGNEDFLQTLLRRFSDPKKERPDAVQAAFVRFFREYAGASPGIPRRTLFRKFAKALSTISREKLYAENYGNTFDFLAWVKNQC